VAELEMQVSDLHEQIEAKSGQLRRYAEKEKNWQAEKEDFEFERAQGGHTAVLEELQEEEDQADRKARSPCTAAGCGGDELWLAAGMFVERL